MPTSLRFLIKPRTSELRRQPRRRPGRPRDGFSMVELICVIAIVGTLGSLTASAFMKRSSVTLRNAGQITGQFLSAARQNAISKGVLTAVVIVTSPGASGLAHRAMVTLELPRRADGAAPVADDWRLATRWEVLPEGIAFDSNPQASTFLGGSLARDIQMPILSYRDKTYAPGTDYVWQIFLPSGRLVSPPSPCTLALVPSPRRSSAADQANYFNFTFIEATGENKVTYP